MEDGISNIVLDGSGFESLIDIDPTLYTDPSFSDYGSMFAIYSSYSWFWWITGILVIVAMWMIFNKAKRPGWAAIIPIYNTVVYLDMVGRPWWWLLLMLIPVVNIVIGIIVLNDLSKAFGQGVGFTIGLIFLPWIFMPILAFGPSQYKGGGVPTPPATPSEHQEPPATPPVQQ